MRHSTRIRPRRPLCHGSVAVAGLAVAMALLAGCALDLGDAPPSMEVTASDGSGTGDVALSDGAEPGGIGGAPDTADAGHGDAAWAADTGDAGPHDAGGGGNPDGAPPSDISGGGEDDAAPPCGSWDQPCNGLDDDCDGSTDEDGPAVGSPCDSGGDGCARGAWECAGEAAVCARDAPCGAFEGCWLDRCLPVQVAVDADSFWMGCSPSLEQASVVGVSCNGEGAGVDSEVPQREVVLPAYGVDVTEVTARSYADFLNQAPAACAVDGACFDPAHPALPIELAAGKWRPKGGLESRPMVAVTWVGADAFCTSAARRLCTEAEWEMAARGGCSVVEKSPGETSTCHWSYNVWPWGQQPATCATCIMAESGLLGCGTNGAHDVGSRPEGASPYGALDMAGNVWEWVADWAAPYPAGGAVEMEPTGPPDGTLKEYRGGSFDDGPSLVRTGARNAASPSGAGGALGFRCCSG